MWCEFFTRTLSLHTVQRRCLSEFERRASKELAPHFCQAIYFTEYSMPLVEYVAIEVKKIKVAQPAMVAWFKGEPLVENKGVD